MKDTHEFFPLLRKFKITRLAALAAAGEDLAQQVPADAVERALESAAASGLSIMCFVGNRGMIQIHTGPVRQLRRTGPWYNVLDPKFNLHLDTTAIASSWVVNKPTSDGWVTSLELYAANGDLIAQFFGERKPGKPELPGWRELMSGCAPCRWPYEDMPMMRKTPMPRPFSGWFARVRSPRRLPARLSAVAAAWLAGLCVAQAAPERVVTLGGSVTEIVYGLGQGARLVGDDQSSLYPPEARRLPSVGYYRAVPVEGVLSLAGSGAGFGAGRSAGRAQAPGRGRRARGDGARPAFGRFAQGAHPRRGRGAGCAAGRRAHDRGSGPRAGPRRGAARQARARHAADQSWRRAGGGRDTAASQLMALAGLVNVMQGQQGYKPLSAEAVGALAPDVLIVTSMSVEASGGLDALLACPAWPRPRRRRSGAWWSWTTCCCWGWDRACRRR